MFQKSMRNISKKLMQLKLRLLHVMFLECLFILLHVATKTEDCVLDVLWSVLIVLLITVNNVAVIAVSKKDSSLRHTELLSHISPAVTMWLSANCQQLMSEHLKHSVVLSVISHCNSMSLSLVLLRAALNALTGVDDSSLSQLSWSEGPQPLGGVVRHLSDELDEVL